MPKVLDESRLVKIEGCIKNQGKVIEEHGSILKEQTKILVRLENAIVDDNKTGTVGYGTRLKVLEKYKDQDRKLKHTILGMFIVLKVTVVGAIIKLWNVIWT